MENNKYSYLDEKVLADRGFHVPTHRIIKIPYYDGDGRTGRGYGRGLGIGFGISLSLHLLLLLSLKAPNTADTAHSHSTATEQTMQVEVVDSRSLEQLTRETIRLPEIVYPNPKAELGPETQYTDANKNDNKPRLSLVQPSHSLEERLRDVILSGKSLDEVYADVKSPGKEDTMDYASFFLTYLKEYLELKQNPRLVAQKTIQENKIDLVITYLARIEEDGRVTFQFEQPRNLKKLERDILNDVTTQLKQIPKFIPPAKANLKSPYQLEVRYFSSYKPLREVLAPLSGSQLKFVPFDR